MNYFHNETEIVMFGLFACDNDKDENEKQEEKDMDEGALDWQRQYQERKDQDAPDGSL